MQVLTQGKTLKINLYPPLVLVLDAHDIRIMWRPKL